MSFIFWILALDIFENKFEHGKKAEVMAAIFISTTVEKNTIKPAIF